MAIKSYFKLHIFNMQQVLGVSFASRNRFRGSLNKLQQNHFYCVKTCEEVFQGFFNHFLHDRWEEVKRSKNLKRLSATDISRTFHEFPSFSLAFRLYRRRKIILNWKLESIIKFHFFIVSFVTVKSKRVENICITNRKSFKLSQGGNADTSGF